jgi:hypothetical protein
MECDPRSALQQFARTLPPWWQQIVTALLFRFQGDKPASGNFLPLSSRSFFPPTTETQLSTATGSPADIETATVLFWFTFFDEVPPSQKGNQMSPF